MLELYHNTDNESNGIAIGQSMTWRLFYFLLQPTAPFLLLFLPRTKKVIILEYSYKKQMEHPLIISGILPEQ